MIKKIIHKLSEALMKFFTDKKDKDRFDKSVVLNREVQLYKDTIEIGDYTYINGGKIFYAKIGKFCSIGYGVILGGGVHYTNTVTTYPIAARVCGYPGLVDFPKQQDCIIGNAVWIGNNAIIMQNVKVGDGAIVGAGAIVTKDVEPYTVVAGVPAKPIRKLFSQEDIDFLEDIKWWDWPVEKIKKYYEKGAFNSIEDLKKVFMQTD